MNENLRLRTTTSDSEGQFMTKRFGFLLQYPIITFNRETLHWFTLGPWKILFYPIVLYIRVSHDGVGSLYPWYLYLCPLYPTVPYIRETYIRPSETLIIDCPLYTWSLYLCPSYPYPYIRVSYNRLPLLSDCPHIRLPYIRVYFISGIFISAPHVFTSLISEVYCNINHITWK